MEWGYEAQFVVTPTLEHHSLKPLHQEGRALVTAVEAHNVERVCNTSRLDAINAYN